MSIRKRSWMMSKGIEKDAWVVDYVDQRGKRHIRKKEVDAYHATAKVEGRHGTHAADSDSVTVEEAGELWITTAEQIGLERSTTDEYRRHLDLHIVPPSRPSAVVATEWTSDPRVRG